MEELGLVCGCQALQELRHGWREAVVNLISRCPKLLQGQQVVLAIARFGTPTVSPPVSGSVWILSMA